MNHAGRTSGAVRRFCEEPPYQKDLSFCGIPFPGGWVPDAARDVGFTMLRLLALAVAFLPGAAPGAEGSETGRFSVSGPPGRLEVVEISGTVLWADAEVHRLILWDGEQVRLWEADWGGARWEPGTRVRGRGVAVVEERGDWTRVGSPGWVVDNDGVHAAAMKSGRLFLQAGRHPFRLEWFNAADALELALEWYGPEGRAGGIPADRFWHRGTGAGVSDSWLPGLRYEVFAVAGERLPTFLGDATLLASGVCAGITLEMLPRREQVAVVFEGFLEVPAAGVWEFRLLSDDGSRLRVGERALEWEVVGQGLLPTPRRVWPGEPLEVDARPFWAVVEGRVRWAARSDGARVMELEAGSGRIRVEVVSAGAAEPEAWKGRWMRVTGVCLPVRGAEGPPVAGRLLVGDAASCEVREEAGVQTGAGQPLVLETAAEVHGLTREEAARGHRVRLRGTVTCVLPEHQAVVIQDSTRGLYVVDRSGRGEGLPQLGDWVEVEGRTDPGLFAPMVYADRVEVRGTGPWPEPVAADWEPLASGSLDAQWVELRGWVTAVRSNGVFLLMREGLLEVELRLRNGVAPPPVAWEDALVRMRGCLFASWDYQTHQVRAGTVRLYAAEVWVEQPPPRDLFDVPLKGVTALRLFDPGAGLFQRVRVRGRLSLQDGRELFLSDGGSGVRAWLRSDPGPLAPGLEVEVAGFPDVAGPGAPVLRHASVRVRGRGTIPEPETLPEGEWEPGVWDARRVRFEGLWVESRRLDRGWLLVLQRGWRTLPVRWVREDAPPEVAPGSRVALTGVLAVTPAGVPGWGRPGGFELRMGPADEWILLARPPFWTLERLLVAVGVLVGILLLATLWITQLHRQVERRGAALEREIRARQRLEQQQALEQERARVARDLHDELGSDLTEISMLLARAQSPQATPERAREYLTQAAKKARQMVTALDEIVWAMNPRHDSLGSLISYLCVHADRFLSLAGIAWRLEEGHAPADLPVDSPRRHHLFLAFKEALTNVVRHAGATEVRFRLDVEGDQLILTVRDNGRGLPPERMVPGMDGLANLRARCEKLGGRLEVESAAGEGTTLRFCLPLGQRS